VDVSALYSKWLRDLRESRGHGGHFPDIAPNWAPRFDGPPDWGDAGIIVPFHIWRMFGDKQILEVSYESMKTWIEFIHTDNQDYLWTKSVFEDFGDWLEINAQTPKDVFDTSYFGYDALLMIQIAGALNRTDDVKTYRELHSNISNAFTKAFVNTTDGKIKGDTQAVYVLALAFELLPQNLRQLAVNHLVDNIKAHDYHYTTIYTLSSNILTTFLSRNFRLIFKSVFIRCQFCE
jgi:alpha-L-rhamnosidase